jgi:hypothetical protein
VGYQGEGRYGPVVIMVFVARRRRRKSGSKALGSLRGYTDPAFLVKSPNHDGTRHSPPLS